VIEICTFTTFIVADSVISRIYAGVPKKSYAKVDRRASRFDCQLKHGIRAGKTNTMRLTTA